MWWISLEYRIAIVLKRERTNVFPKFIFKVLRIKGGMKNNRYFITCSNFYNMFKFTKFQINGYFEPILCRIGSLASIGWTIGSDHAFFEKLKIYDLSKHGVQQQKYIWKSFEISLLWEFYFVWYPAMYLPTPSLQPPSLILMVHLIHIRPP